MAGRAVMGVEADAREGELRHIGFGDDHAAGGAEPMDDGRVGYGRRCIGQNLRAGAGRLARHVEEVLDADDRTLERTQTYSCPRPRVGCLGCVTCDLRIDSEAGAGTLAFPVRYAAESFFQPVPGTARLGT